MSGSMLGLFGHIATAGEKSHDGNVFVDFFPMKADAAQLDLLPLGGARAQEAWKPRQRHADCAPVGEIDPHRVFVKTNGCRGNDLSHRLWSALKH